MQHCLFFNCIFGFSVFKPVDSRFVNWVFDNIDVFEFGFVEMKNQNLIRGQSIFGNDVRFCEKMRQIILDRHIEIRIVNIFKQGFIRILASMFDNVLDFVYVSFKHTDTGLNQHNTAIRSSHFIAFCNNLFWLILNLGIRCQVFITKVIC